MAVPNCIGLACRQPLEVHTRASKGPDRTRLTKRCVVADDPVCHGLCGAQPAPSSPAAKRYVVWRKITIKKLRIILILSLLCVLTIAEENPKYSKTADAKVQELRKKINKELSTLEADHWAGSYYSGDGLGVNVSMDIAPKTGFVFELHGCLGLYDRNYGKAQERENEIHLTFDFENLREGGQGIAPDFFAIKWGERRYLIATDEVVEFCNAINYGSEPRDSDYGSFLLHKGDYKKKAEGIPLLPEQYRPYFLRQPIKAEIVKVGKTSIRPSGDRWDFKDIVVVLNAGKMQGVLNGMKFHVYCPANRNIFTTVVNISDDSCETVMTQMGEVALLPEIGWKLSTASRWEENIESDANPTQITNAPAKK